MVSQFLKLILIFVFLIRLGVAQEADSLDTNVQPATAVMDSHQASVLPPDTLSDIPIETTVSDTTSVDSQRQGNGLTNPGTVPVSFRKLPNHAFGVGEYLEFEIAFKFVTAGTAVMSIPDTVWIEGRPCYHIVTTAESNPFFSTFYKVEDRVESVIDMEGMFPWRFEKRIREGRYKADRSVKYDQINHIVYGHKDTLTVQSYIQGVLSSFYYVRTLPLKVGSYIDIDNYGDGKVYPLRVYVLGKEKVSVPAGKFNCIVIEPVLRTEGIFNQKGRLKIWITDDERRIPVIMKSKILVGSIDCRLTKIGNNNP